jgi:hypothetical protein
MFLNPAPSFAALSRPEEEDGLPVCFILGLSLNLLEWIFPPRSSGELDDSATSSREASLREKPNLPAAPPPPLLLVGLEMGLLSFATGVEVCEVDRKDFAVLMRLS